MGSAADDDCWQEFQAFLAQHRVARGQPHNFTLAARPFGSFQIPDAHIERFYTVYQRVVGDSSGWSATSRNPPLTEKPGKFCPILVDLDFKYELTEGEPERKYTNDFIKSFVLAYFDFLKRYIVIDDSNNRCYVFERPAPYKTEKNTKDGIHMMFPLITMPPEIKFLARDHILKTCGELLRNLGTVNPAADMFDRAVIDRNNWYVYGSGKPNCDPYRLTQILDDQLNELPILMGTEELIPFLSVRGQDCSNVTFTATGNADLESDYQTWSDSSRGLNRNAQHSAARRSRFDSCTDLSFVKSLTQALSIDRADDYSSWMQVGWCLHNINPDLMDDWIEFSKRSTKYEEGCCESRWHHMREEGLGIGSLVRWVKMDNPEEYERIRREDIRNLVEKCSKNKGAHHSVASVLYGMYRYQFICLSRKFKSWIEFRCHRWHRTEDGYGLLVKVSNELYNVFSNTTCELYRRAGETQDEDEKAMIDKKIKCFSEVSSKLLDSNYKTNIMKEAYELFYVEGFEDKLDVNPQLIGFENGVYDLDKQEFRDGRPEDCITLTTGSDYLPYDPERPIVRDVHRIVSQMHSDPVICTYVLKLLASFLSGQIRQQKFHIWTGHGSNGKSQLVDMFCSGLGQYTAVLPIALLTSRRASSNAASPELARTKGRRFCVLQEPEDDVRINVGLMKELTGGDRIVSRELYGPILEFKPQFKMVLTCNKLPDIPSNDGGTWRRIRAVEFKSKFCENPDPQNPLEFPVDTSLSTRIDELGQGLVSILIEYYRRYVDEGLIEPAAITNYTMEYQKRCDVFLEFVQSYVIPTEDRRDIVRVSEVYGSFKEWYRQNEPDMSKLPNSKDLRDYVNTRMKRVCSHNMWRGLKLRAIGEEVFDSDSEAGDDDQVL